MSEDILSVFKALADEVRLRILGCLAVSELSVAELVSVLGLPQSTVSRHLKPLRDIKLVETRRDGTSMFYRPGPAFRQPELSSLIESRLSDFPHAHQDALAVRKALEERRRKSQEYFDAMAGTYSNLNEPGGGWRAMTSALAAGFLHQTVADLGAGEGHLSLLLARFAAQVNAVDSAEQMVSYLQRQADEAGLSDRIACHLGDLEHLPLESESQDACFLSQALHHAAQPAKAILEAARVLREGGRLILLDLMQHQLEWVREQMADQWLGFSPKDLQNWMRQARLKVIFNQALPGSNPDLPVLFSVGIKNNPT